MTPLYSYQAQCAQSLIIADDQQEKVMLRLQRLYEGLLTAHQQRTRAFAIFRKPPLLQGVYLWGGVGVGKTFLMDAFYRCIHFAEKKRMHFHAFMRWIHYELKNRQGTKNPLEKIVSTLGKECYLLCLDELVVSDIADAVILANLFRALIAHGVCLVITSNLPPDDLYKKGLQRPLFLPAIALLKTNMDVIHLAGNMDYRNRLLKNAGVFFAPQQETTHANMEMLFHALNSGALSTQSSITICGREIAVKKHGQAAVWFEFDKICGIPRNQHDYLEIADNYASVFISNVPVIPPQDRSRVTLFIKLIDVLYDNHIRLILSSPNAINDIYPEGALRFEFARTLSRLAEMQSEEYFLKPRSTEILDIIRVPFNNQHQITCQN